jgi:acyl-coenzyme A thioesterase PaaI-like protein
MSSKPPRTFELNGIHSSEQSERAKNPQWIEETEQLLNETFKEAESRLRLTVMSDNHDDEELNAGEADLRMLRQDMIMQRNAERGLDNFVASNSFCLNRLLYRGWWNENDSEIHWLMRVGPGAVGPPGGAHGGALAAVLDQFAGYVAVPHGWCVTGELKLTYKSMVPLEEVVYVASKVTKIEGRRVFCKMTVHALPFLASDEKAISSASNAGAEVRKLKEPVEGHTHYVIPPVMTIAEATMIKIPAYRGGRTLQSLPPGFASAWTFGFDLPQARL